MNLVQQTLIQIDRNKLDRDSGIYFMENGSNTSSIINDKTTLVLSDGDFTNTLYVYGAKLVETP